MKLSTLFINHLTFVSDNIERVNKKIQNKQQLTLEEEKFLKIEFIKFRKYYEQDVIF